MCIQQENEGSLSVTKCCFSNRIQNTRNNPPRKHPILLRPKPDIEPPKLRVIEKSFKNIMAQSFQKSPHSTEGRFISQGCSSIKIGKVASSNVTQSVNMLPWQSPSIIYCEAVVNPKQVSIKTFDNSTHLQTPKKDKKKTVRGRSIESEVSLEIREFSPNTRGLVFSTVQTANQTILTERTLPKPRCLRSKEYKLSNHFNKPFLRKSLSQVININKHHYFAPSTQNRELEYSQASESSNSQFRLESQFSNDCQIVSKCPPQNVSEVQRALNNNKKNEPYLTFASPKINPSQQIDGTSIELEDITSGRRRIATLIEILDEN